MGSTVKKDELTGAAITIDFPHHEIHEGDLYQVNISSTSIANAAWLSIATPGAIGAASHFTFTGALDGSAQLELIEGATYSSSGTVTSTATAFNMHRNKGDYAVKMIVNSSVITGGTAISREIIPGGEKVQSVAGSGGSRPGLEWITDATKTYIVKLTNKAGAAKAATVSVNFYTHDASPKGRPAYWSSSA